jgi:secreted Zn-dependent insulinase-like peptidase
MAQYLKMADRLRKITGLKFEKRNVRFDHDSSRVEFVEQLAAQRMIPPFREPVRIRRAGADREPVGIVRQVRKHQ